LVLARATSSPKGLATTLNVSQQGKGFNGLYNTGLVENVLIENNDNGCIPIYLSGNTGPSGLGSLSNVIVRNNTNVHSLRMLGSNGGQQNFLYNNKGLCAPVLGTSATVDYSCCTVSLNPDPNQSNVNTNTGLTPLSCAPCAITNPCLSPTFPGLRLLKPSADSVVSPGTISFNYEAEFDQRNSCTFDSVVFYQDLTSLGAAVITGNSVATLNSILLPARPYEFFVTAKLLIPNSSPSQYSVSNAFKLIGKTPTGIYSKANAEINVYPNPGNTDVYVKFSTPPASPDFLVTVSDMLGKTLLTSRLITDESNLGQKLSIESLPVGIYNMVISNGQTRLVKQLIKK
jgi:Secretion system C-terminal sorting domain